MKKIIAREILLLLFFCCTPLLWFGKQIIILGHDSGFRFDTIRHMRELFFSWQSGINTGVDWTVFKGLIMIHVPEALLTTIFGSLEKAQPFVFVFWMFTMAIGMYALLAYIFPDRKYWLIRISGSLFFVYNFFILQGWSIAERAKFSLYAALPLVFLTLLLMNTKKISLIKGAIQFGFVYFIFNGGGSPPLYGSHIILWIVSFLFFSIRGFTQTGLKEVGKVIVIYSMSFLFLLGFNAYWIIPEIGLFRSSYTQAVSQEGGIEGLIAWEREISKHTSITNLLRLQGMADWYDNPVHAYSNFYFTQPLLIIGSFVPLFILLLALLHRKFHIKDQQISLVVILCILLLVISLPLAAGSHPPMGSLYLFFMRHIPGFAIFRSSYYKFAPLLFFCFSILTAYSVYIFQTSLRHKKLAYLIGVLWIAYIIGYHFPYFSSSFFRFSSQFTTRLSVPEYVKTTGAYLDSVTPTSGRVLILPPLDRGFINRPIDTYNWGFYSLDILPRIVSDRRILANDSPEGIVQALYETILEERSADFMRLSQVLNVTHILFRADIVQSELGKKQSNPEKIHSFVANLLGTSTYKDGSWEVFSMPKPEVSDISVANTATAAPGMAAIPLASITLPTVDKDSESFVSRSTIEAECFWCAPKEYENYIQSIVLPVPDSRFKKIFKSIKRTTPLVTVDSELSRSLKLLSEAISQQNNQLLLQSLEALEMSSKKINELTARDFLYYTARLHAFILKYEEFVQQHFPKETEMLQKIKTSSETLKKNLWVSDAEAYRMVINLPEEAFYVISVYPYNKDLKVSMDGQNVSTDSEIKLSQGVHKIEIPKTEEKIPLVSFSNKRKELSKFETQTQIHIGSQTPTFYDLEVIAKEKGRYLLTLNQTFNPGWKIYKKDEMKLINDATHVKVNGYANGWIISMEENQRYIIRYEPQENVYTGIIVTAIFLLTSFIIMAKQKIHREGEV